MDQTILQKIENDKKLSKEEIDMLTNRYPYLVMPLLERLDSDPDPEITKTTRRKIAALVSSHETRRILLGEDSEEYASFYPDMQRPELSTEDTIDTFIERFNKTNHSAEENELPVIPALDYTQLIEGPSDEDNTTRDSTSDAIDSFLGKTKSQPEIAVKEDLTDPEQTTKTAPAPDSSLSESLAFAMIKNRNYEKALQIISELSLIYPKKSVYFADQIRFLKKLIIIESKKA